MKFKVGDKVTIREDLEVGSVYGDWSLNCIMAYHKGRKAIIIKVNRGAYHIDLDGGLYSWTDEMLEPYKELNKEHYGKEIIEIAILDNLAVDKHTRKPTTCAELKCEDCVAGGCVDCSIKLKEWGDGEYIEPKKKIKLTQFEYEYLKKLKGIGMEYLARDKNERIYGFEIRPTKNKYEWLANGRSTISRHSLIAFNDIFTFVKWEDEEPYLIDYILENCEVIENVD
ncbi:hypothetical protein [Longibaculum muris]|uniref:hypothetical protein n=1 Tax=Longibaculum muris TaxID=1796628 RepID=UPI0022E7F883|nr:hypothetical protein [Longibaculum muris]